MQEEKSDGKRRMQQTWQHILDGLCFVLKQDARIRTDAFTEQFTAEKFADVLFSMMLSALMREDYDATAYWKSSAEPFIKNPLKCGIF